MCVCLSLRAGIVGAVAGAVLTTAVALGQGGPSAPGATKARPRSTVPRMPDGKPDLQGVWSFATVTPMERPSELGEKAVLSEAEAADFEATSARRSNRDTNVPAGNVGDYNNFWYDRGTSVLGNRRTSLITDPPDGRIPPLTAEAQRRVDEAAAARRGIGVDEPTPGGFVEDLGSGGLRVRCILGFNSGPPMTPGAYNNNVQVFQTPTHVALLNEMVHNARIIPVDGRPRLPAGLRQWVGDSRGHWDGDTLIVTTTNFLRETTFRNSSARMQLVERFTRVDEETLNYEFTVTDPTTWTKPWTASVLMSRSTEPVYEYACHEGNYGLFGILGGAAAPTVNPGTPAPRSK